MSDYREVTRSVGSQKCGVSLLKTWQNSMAPTLDFDTYSSDVTCLANCVFFYSPTAIWKHCLWQGLGYTGDTRQVAEYVAHKDSLPIDEVVDLIPEVIPVHVQIMLSKTLRYDHDLI